MQFFKIFDVQKLIIIWFVWKQNNNYILKQLQNFIKSKKNVFLQFVH